jgi:hypothetical protein
MEPLGFQIKITYLKEFAMRHHQTDGASALGSIRMPVQAYPHILIAEDV